MLFKNIIIAVSVFLLFSVSAMCQSNGHNMVKLNLSALAAKGINLQYERKVSSRMTLALGYSKISNSSLTFSSLINSYVGIPNIKVGDYTLGTSILTPEVKYYYGRGGAFHGFYISLYGRVGTYRLHGPVEYVSPGKANRLAIFDGKVNSYSGGALMGSSFSLSKSIYLDWWILGISAGAANGNFKAETPLSSTEQMSLKDELNNFDIPFTTVEAEATSSGATAKTSGNIIGLRGLGINIGIRF